LSPTNQPTTPQPQQTATTEFPFWSQNVTAQVCGAQ
jgi:hypothetical protein